MTMYISIVNCVGMHFSEISQASFYNVFFLNIYKLWLKADFIVRIVEM